MPIVSIKNPSIEDEERTYLSAEITSGTTINVADYSGFSDDDYLILGTYGKEKSELVQINDASIDSSIVLENAVKYSHPANTRVITIPFNEYSLERATSESGTFSVVATAVLQVDDEYTYYNDTAGSSTSWYKVRYYNRQDTNYSSYSDAMQATGFKANSRGRLKEMAKSLFGDRTGKWVEEDQWDDLFYQVENEVYNFRKKWAFLQTGTAFALTIGRHEEDLATKVSDIVAPEKKYVESIRISDGDLLTYKDRKDFDELMEGAQYTTLDGAITSSNTTATLLDGDLLDTSGSAYIEGSLMGITGNTANLISFDGTASAKNDGDEIWMKSELDEPQDYTIWGGMLKFNPCADTAYICHITYNKKGTPMSEDNAVSEIPRPTSLLLNGVLAYAYAIKVDEKMYKEKRAEFLNELKKRSYAERLGQKQSLTPSDETGYREGVDYVDFDKGYLKEIKNKYRSS